MSIDHALCLQRRLNERKSHLHCLSRLRPTGEAGEDDEKSYCSHQDAEEDIAILAHGNSSRQETFSLSACSPPPLRSFLAPPSALMLSIQAVRWCPLSQPTADLPGRPTQSFQPREPVCVRDYDAFVAVPHHIPRTRP